MSENAKQQLESFIAKFNAADQRLIRAVRTVLRRRLPAANELVYDNYNFFVIGYSPTERPSDAILSIAARANGVGVCFLHGARLPDPHKLLLGSGRQTRFLRVESAGDLKRPQVEALIAAAISRGKAQFAVAGRGRLIIRSVSAKAAASAAGAGATGPAHSSTRVRRRAATASRWTLYALRATRSRSRARSRRSECDDARAIGVGRCRRRARR